MFTYLKTNLFTYTNLWFAGLGPRVAACLIMKRMWIVGFSYFFQSQLACFRLYLLLERQRVKANLTKDAYLNKTSGYRKKIMHLKTFQVSLEKVCATVTFANTKTDVLFSINHLLNNCISWSSVTMIKFQASIREPLTSYGIIIVVAFQNIPVDPTCVCVNMCIRFSGSGSNARELHKMWLRAYISWFCGWWRWFPTGWSAGFSFIFFSKIYHSLTFTVEAISKFGERIMPCHLRDIFEKFTRKEKVPPTFNFGFFFFKFYYYFIL